MNVLSLFDGISCGQIALNKIGIKVDNYYASEIDKNAVKITQKNFPDTIQLGSVTEISYKDGILYTENGEYNVGKIDIVMGGSPCQGFSLSGKQLGFDDPRSKLFFDFVKILKDVQPKYFLLENVRMKKEFLNIITEYLNVEPIMINSSVVSAQNRIRYYWTNIPKIKYPEDNYQYLKDILNLKTNQNLQNNIIMREFIEKVKVRKYDVNIPKLQELLKQHKTKSIKQISKELNIKKTTVEHWFRTDKCFSIPSADIWDNLKKCLNIETNDFDLPIKEFIIKDNIYDMANRVYHIAGKSPTLTASGINIKAIDDDENIFILNRNHCEVLQTIPIGYTSIVSENIAKKMIGNGWTVDVIAHIFKNISENT